VRKAVLDTWAEFMACPEVATKAINFIAVDWPSQQWTGGSYTSYVSPGAWTSLREAYFKPCGRIHWCVARQGGGHGGVWAAMMRRP
jgi:monoamine oxidase